MSNNAHDLSNRLLNALDNNYNVVDMHTVNEIISILEKINITKELLETTRLGKHVNELRRKTTDPTLARRAKVLVKRWRDLVIPTKASPAHTGSNRSSAERQVRRLGGTPLTSPALSRHVLSPAVNSPRPPSRPAWGGYESDSQDVILVDDDPPPAPLPPAPAPAHLTPPAKRALSPAHTHDDKKAKRDKKPKKRRGHSRAGSGTEAVALAPPPAAAPSLGLGAGAQTPAGAPAAAWGARNGTHERRRNGCRRDAVDPYAALVNKIPAAGAKKVKTTKELLEQIQSRGSKPAEPAPDDQDDDVVLVDDECPIKVDSPVVNGGGAARSPSPPAAPPPPPLPPLEDERRHYECTCGEERAEEACPAARAPRVLPAHVAALHHALLPGVNGTRAPPLPHQFAVRRPARDDRPDLFASVVPLYKYSDYADDYCVKNMARVPLCDRLPWTEFAPPPPSPPAPPSPPPLRPYPTDPPPDVKAEPPEPPDEGASPRPEPEAERAERRRSPAPKIEPEMVSLPTLEPSERLKAPLLSPEEATQFGAAERPAAAAKEPAADEFAEEQRDHRTVERTKVQLDGRALHEQCLRALRAAPYSYADADPAPVLTLPQEPAPGEAEAALRAALEGAASERTVDELGRPPRPAGFAEWHECARLGELVALPYVVID